MILINMAQKELILDELVIDVLFYITTYLNDNDKMTLLLTNKKMYSLGNKITFTRYYTFSKIVESALFDNFEAVIIDCNIYHQKVWPKKIKKIACHRLKNPWIHYNYQRSKDNMELTIPSSIEYLEIGETICILNNIPDTCKKIIYHGKLSKNIIPFGVKKLVLEEFNNKISKFIPESVDTFVYKCKCYNVGNRIFNCDNVPKNISYLKLTNLFNDILEGQFPDNILKLKFSDHFGQSLKGHLPKKLKFLKLGSSFDFLLHSEIFRQEFSSYLPDSILNIEVVQFYSAPDVYSLVKYELKGFCFSSSRIVSKGGMLWCKIMFSKIN